MIREKKGKFYLYSHEGKLLGKHGSRAEAEAQESAINISKARAAGHRIPKKDAHQGVYRVDRSELERPVREANGWMRVDGFVARTGIQTYLRADGSSWNEYRPAEEVFDAATMKSFELVPLTNNHPGVGLLDANNTKSYQIGSIGIPEQSGDKARSRMLVTDSSGVSAIEAGRVQLSCGYVCDLDETPGTFNGQRYDAVQRNIRGNHVALVDRARGGEQLRLRADSMSVQIPVQVENKKRNELQQNRLEKVRCEHCGNMVFADEDGDCPNCGFDIDMDPEVRKDRAMMKMCDKCDKKVEPDEDGDCPHCGSDLGGKGARKDSAMKFSEMEQRIARLEAERHIEKVNAERATARADAAEAELKKLKTDHAPDSIQKAVAARVVLERSAGAILGRGAKFDGLSDVDVKRQVAEKVNGIKLDGKSEVYIDAAYEIALKKHADDPGAIAAAQMREDVATFEQVREDGDGVDAHLDDYKKRMRELHTQGRAKA